PTSLLDACTATPPTYIYTLSLHDALPISQFQAFYKNPVIATALNLVYGVPIVPINGSPASNRTDLMSILLKYPGQALDGSNCGRSEEHTSELQSPYDIVCRLLLEKIKNIT